MESDARHDSILASAAERLGLFALGVYAMAFPWELFQRMPVGGGTLTKFAAVLCVAAAVLKLLIVRRWPVRKSTIALPVALFAAVSAASLMYTIDRDATIARLVLYATYAVFFGAAASLLTLQASKMIVIAFISSATALAAYTVACYFGWLWPTFWGTSLWPHQPLLLEYRDGVAMRMAGASNDFNAPAMTMLVAFGASLFLFDWRRLGNRRGAAIAVALVLHVAAIAIAMSRSGLLLAALLLGVRLLTGIRSTRSWFVVGGMAIALLALVLIAPSAFLQTLLHRMEGGFAYDDPSLRGRGQVYTIGFDLLRRYGVFGSGLGTVDTALAQSARAEDAVMTVHSMPLALSIELGVLGFAAWLWLWLAIGVSTVRAYRRAESPEARRHALAFAAMAVSVFGMTLVQPFATAPLYPLLLAIGFGPWTARTTLSPSQPRAWVYALVASCCAIVVVLNAAAFQTTARLAERYFDQLHAGIECEQRGDGLFAWQPHYARAMEIAAAEDRLKDRPYYAEAMDVVDIAPLFATLHIVRANPDPIWAAWEAAMRAQLGQGQIPIGNAIARLTSMGPEFTLLRMQIADAMWTVPPRRGMDLRDGAIQFYEEAAAAKVGRPEFADIRRLRKLEQRMTVLQPGSLAAPDYRILDFFERYLLDSETGERVWPETLRLRQMAKREVELSTRSEETAMLERADLLRCLGKWDDAVALCKQVLERYPNSSHALYLTGVAFELDGNTEEARNRYRAAVQALPNHVEAQAALRTLESTP